MTRRAHIVSWLVAIFCWAIWFPTGLAEASSLKRLKTEVAAADFALSDLNGKSVRLSDFEGKVVLLNFWATWCPTCVSERPSLQRLWEAYHGHGLVILAVSTDRSRPEKVKAFVERHGVSFPVLHDPDGLVSPQYGVVGIPTSVLVTPNGVIAYRMVGGYRWDGPEAKWAIDRLLGEVKQ